MFKLACGIVVAISMAPALATASEASPVGSWQFAYYHVPSGAFYANQTICFKEDKTWYSSTQANWKGAWFQSGDDLQWYGSVPMNGVGSANNIATISIGRFTDAGAMGGIYTEWAAPSALPLGWDKHYTYKMTFKGTACGAPK